MSLVTRSVMHGAPVVGVLYQEPLDDQDSGYRVWSAVDDTFDTKSVRRRRALVCVRCLLVDHPEVGALMDRARARGADGVALVHDDPREETGA